MKKTIQLKESDLTRMIMEAVNELDWKTYANAAKKRSERGEIPDETGLHTSFQKKFNGNHEPWDFGVEYPTKGPYFDIYGTGQDDDPFKVIGSHYGSEGTYSNGKFHGPSGMYKLSPSHYKQMTPNYDMKPEDYFGDEMGKRYREAQSEVDDYNNGNYEYKPYKEGGTGWTKKNESIVREAVNRTLRKYLR